MRGKRGAIEKPLMERLIRSSSLLLRVLFICLSVSLFLSFFFSVFLLLLSFLSFISKRSGRKGTKNFTSIGSTVEKLHFMSLRSGALFAAFSVFSRGTPEGV